MKKDQYNNLIPTCTDKILGLPSSEVKYYLLLLVNSIKETNTDFTRNFLVELLVLVNALESITTSSSGTSYESMGGSYQRLVDLAQTNTLTTKVGYNLLNLGSGISALLVGTASGIIGGFAGLARGLWNLNNPFSSFAIGLITGCTLGAAIGFRLPKKLFKNELIRQIKFCLDGISSCISTLEQQQPFSFYEESVKKRLLDDYFQGNQDLLDAFLANNICYEIATFKAQFISETLEGYLGHHAFIKILIKPEGKPLVIEFSTGRNDLQRPISQIEKRTVSGKRIVEMLAMHEQLQLTHACTMDYMIKKLKPGENDCFSYINKILVASSQRATSLKRFDGQENWVGRNVIGFFVQKLNPFKQDILLQQQEIESNVMLNGVK
ncbi:MULTISPECIES: hypothetical protein [unclassified Legionella]|uniref:hypothetical protein n=1 Tax=unclassified Legionella TaxID=2622702 RepID=UPI001055CDFA|nr:MULTISPECIES: hypothetical protein [unclassified Legionella]MDI9817721.1 hypothetical protein [Legionella sp. PL877]